MILLKFLDFRKLCELKISVFEQFYNSLSIYSFFFIKLGCDILLTMELRR